MNNSRMIAGMISAKAQLRRLVFFGAGTVPMSVTSSLSVAMRVAFPVAGVC